MIIIIIIIIIIAFSAIIASYTFLERGPILGPDEVPREFFIRWTETSSVCAPFLGG